MEVTTIQKFMHTSPRKLRLVADMVRKMVPNRALDVLRVTPKLAAKDLAKAIETVLANSKQRGRDIEKMSFKSIEVNESSKMRRFRAGTKGRVRPFKRRMAHIKIVLSDELASRSEGKVNDKKQGNKETQKNKETLGGKK